MTVLYLSDSLIVKYRTTNPELLNIMISKSSDIGGFCHCWMFNLGASLDVMVTALKVFSVRPLYLLNVHNIAFSSGANLQEPLDTSILQSSVSGGTGIFMVTFFAVSLLGNKDFKVILY